MNNTLYLVLKIILILLSLATGGVKLFELVPEDVALFAEIGFSNFATRLFGGVQLIGGLLLIWPRSKRLAAWALSLSFVMATGALFVSGQLTFAFFSILFIALALLVALKKPVVSITNT